MKKESLELVIDTVINSIEKLEMDHVDKIELMINLHNFLINYEPCIKVLRKELNRDV